MNIDLTHILDEDAALITKYMNEYYIEKTTLSYVAKNYMTRLISLEEFKGLLEATLRLREDNMWEDAYFKPADDLYYWKLYLERIATTDGVYQVLRGWELHRVADEVFKRREHTFIYTKKQNRKRK